MSDANRPACPNRNPTPEPDPRHPREDGLRRGYKWLINLPSPVMSNGQHSKMRAYVSSFICHSCCEPRLLPTIIRFGVPSMSLLKPSPKISTALFMLATFLGIAVCSGCEQSQSRPATAAEAESTGSGPLEEVLV